MNFIRAVIEQPVTVAVGVIMTIMAGLIALQRIPIQLTPNVDDTIISVSTFWEGASPEEIEREIIDEQEEMLQGITNLREMTSQSQQGQGSIRLEFRVGTDKEVAIREVSDKLRQVSDYPDNADEPVVTANDPMNRDFIAWVVFESTDRSVDIRQLQDFAEDRIEPVLERVEGISEINVLGGRQREVQIQFDAALLARYGITINDVASAIQRTNRNISAGQIDDGKSAIRLRATSQYETPEQVEETVIQLTQAGQVTVGDVARVKVTFKDPTSFVRSRGHPVIAINAQREPGSNVIRVMTALQEEIARLNAPGGVLDQQSQAMRLDGRLQLTQVYDQTIYIDDALALVRNNIWIGGGLAVFVLLLFLRSFRSVGIIAMAIPISVIGAIVVMVLLGRSINVISLAGMAFAVGLVVDNAIVVLENIFRHLEMGKSPHRAALDGAKEVWGAVLASTLTTIFVFIPILLIEEEAGQLFRDIALAICAAVGLSLLVSIAVIPSASARLLRTVKPRTAKPSRARRLMGWITWPVRSIPTAISGLIYALCGSWFLRIAIVAILTAASLWGSYLLMPPADYLPAGNRNLIFGILIPPPGYNINQQEDIARRIESTIRPYWEAGKLAEGTPERAAAEAALPAVPTFDWAKQAPGKPITPPAIANYFVVGFTGTMFHGGTSADPERAADLAPLFQQATGQQKIPGVLGFAFQVPLFRLGGTTGSAISIDVQGGDLANVTRSATALYGVLGGTYGFGSVQTSPSNFNIYGPELRLRPNLQRLADVGMAPADLGLALQTAGDGAIIGEYRLAGETVDLKLISRTATGDAPLLGVQDTPVATPSGSVVPLSALATFAPTTSPPQINHTSRQRSVSLEFTPPEGVALDEAIAELGAIVEMQRQAGVISPEVTIGFAGSASKLESVKRALLGDGTWIGLIGSSLFLALVVVYLLMCALFQSFAYPLVIMFSVPLATLGGFAALKAVAIWSYIDRHMPVQNLDVLTMLGFVILIGIVVNNAILIVHQARNFMRGEGDVDGTTSEPLPPRRAIAESVRSRIRPIFMSTLTSVGGMLPLVLMPGPGSELYRGLGSVVVGGLLVSTVFTLFLVPLLLSMFLDVKMAFVPKHSRAHRSATIGIPAGATRSSD